MLLAGCGSDAAPERAAAPTPAPRTVHFRAADGRRLHATFTAAQAPGAPAAVLVHGLYGEPGQWRGFAAALNQAGFATLAYASRSDHEPDEGVLVRDVVGAVRALRLRADVDPDRIVLVGASVGASTVAYTLGTRPRLPVRGGVGISALEGPREIALGRRGAFRPHDLLLITDAREAGNARALRRDARGRGVTIEVTETTAHGSALLDDAGVRAMSIRWLRARVAG